MGDASPAGNPHEFAEVNADVNWVRWEAGWKPSWLWRTRPCSCRPHRKTVAVEGDQIILGRGVVFVGDSGAAAIGSGMGGTW